MKTNQREHLGHWGLALGAVVVLAGAIALDDGRPERDAQPVPSPVVTTATPSLATWEAATWWNRALADRYRATAVACQARGTAEHSAGVARFPLVTRGY